MTDDRSRVRESFDIEEHICRYDWSLRWRGRTAPHVDEMRVDEAHGGCISGDDNAITMAGPRDDTGACCQRRREGVAPRVGHGDPPHMERRAVAELARRYALVALNYVAVIEHYDKAKDVALS